MANSSFKAIVHGYVQGVGFRYFAFQKAQVYNVNGFVENLPNGSVKVFAEGDVSSLEDFLSELKKGPFSAEVQRVDVEWLEFTGHYSRFFIER